MRKIKSRRMRWTGYVERMGEERKVYKVFVLKAKGKIPLGKPRRRWENWIRMDLREIGWGECRVDPVDQNRDWWRAVVNTVMNMRVLAPQSQSVTSAG
jgi:hypothetical protein